MSTPRGLLAAAHALWGFSIGQPALGITVGVACEGLQLLPEGVRSRLAVHAVRLVRASAAAAFGLLVFVVVTQEMPQSLYTWLRWLPLTLLPLVALAAGSGLRLAQLVNAVRPDLEVEEGERTVDLLPVDLAITLAAAGTGTAVPTWLYAGLAALVGWALLTRVPAARRHIAAAMLILAGLVGYGLQLGIYRLQGQVEEWSTDLIAGFLAAPPDPSRERTRIGDLGRVKLSERIVWRVEAPAGGTMPLLLQEAGFERYASGQWHAARGAPQQLPRSGDRWQLPGEGQGGGRGAQLGLRRSFGTTAGLLPLPRGTSSIDDLAADALELFPSGAVLGRGLPRRLAFQVAYDGATNGEAPHAERDLQVPASLAPALQSVLVSERLRGDNPVATAAAVQSFFARGFAYSLDLGDRRGGADRRTIVDFLLRDRKGHCEYFATATVLLLRQAGIPARYVGGYSVQEYSPRDRAYLVRARHAHAWAVAFIDGRWVAIDTTPARWAEIEAEEAQNAFSPLLDDLSWLFDRVADARDRLLLGGGSSLAALGALLGAVLLAISARALHRRARARQARGGDAVTAAWHRIERQAAKKGHGRAPGETARQWTRRLALQDPAPPWAQELLGLADAYYRARFDPTATGEAVQAFIGEARAWRVPPPAR